MPDITTVFAFRVRDLHRRGMTVERIADRLSASLEDVMEAHRMLDLPQHGDTSDTPPERSDAGHQETASLRPRRERQGFSRRQNLATAISAGDLATQVPSARRQIAMTSAARNAARDAMLEA